MRKHAKHKKRKKSVIPFTFTDPKDTKELVVQFPKSKKIPKPKAAGKSSSEEDPDYNAAEFAELQKQINANYGVTKDAVKQQKGEIFSYSDYTDSSVGSGNGKCCIKLRHCFNKICCCCRKKSKVTPLEGMNEVEDRVELSEHEQKFLTEDINPESGKLNLHTIDSYSIPLSLVNQGNKKKVKLRVVGHQEVKLRKVTKKTVTR